MSSTSPPPAVATYLADVEPAALPLATALDAAVRRAHPSFDVAIKYGILMYTINQDWRTWVCAIDVTSKRIGLRFLYGVLLDDPLGVLRAGSSVLKTWDLGFGDTLDPTAVGAYVSEAVARHSAYKAEAERILAESRAANGGKRAPKTG